jgi:hypothetical protein
VFHDATNLVAYDVKSDTWTLLDQHPDVTGPAGLARPPAVVLVVYDSRQDVFVAYADNGPLDSHVAAPATWTFNPRTGTWSHAALVQTPDVACGWGFAPECGAVLDERTGLAVFVAMGGTQVLTYDASRATWQTSRQGDWCDNDTPVYDSVNVRIVCRAGWTGVAALAMGTGTSAGPAWLIEPLPGPGPTPPPP